MNATEYFLMCRRTDTEDYDGVLNRLNSREVLELLHSNMGLVTEVGELMDALKKWAIYGREMDRANVVEEVGDILWYISLALKAVDSDFEDAMERNINKLTVRYPNKFTEEKALNRNLEEERKVLEK